MIELVGIAIRPRPRAAMQTLEHCLVSPEKGLAGDARGRPGRRQVTVLSEEAWQQACAELQSAGDELQKLCSEPNGLPWTTRRANLLVRGLTFGPQQVGSILRIGDLLLRITRETDPCSRMDEAVPGLQAALTPDWRGGVCCQVIAGGAIAIGDTVSLEPPAQLKQSPAASRR